MKTAPIARLLLEDGITLEGYSFGATKSTAGEIVFNTGMVGYPESLTDPSYTGQILVLTYPLIGNYGVPSIIARKKLPPFFESKRIQVQGLIVSDYSPHYSHYRARFSLGDWLKREGIPALYGIDTRALTQRLREKGTMLGKIEFDGQPTDWWNPDRENLVARVSCQRPVIHGNGTRTIALLDCGSKHNIIRHLLRRGVRVVQLPWNYPLDKIACDGLVISNGPGDPKMCRQTILQVRKAMERRLPILGICLGHQILALAAGANTYKLKYGHRSQNQPVQEMGSNRCFITSQNHGFAVDNKTLPTTWQPWFINLNDGTNEGIRHQEEPFLGVQFHPEASPGPVDTHFIFDEFLKRVGA